MGGAWPRCILGPCPQPSMQVLKSLELFCQYTQKPKNGSLAKVLVGKEALQEKLLEAEAKQAKKQLQFSDLSDLHVFLVAGGA